ncbi:DUF4221 domain-containing protein [Algoriphagus halophytocola]|uniref:DUF4221 domain-containing protein n=1 Tax=Algoriphagus halophytocola TaxID=2991499 RepID=A0ABY6MD41_9BACT|nr:MULTISPECIES: DUF4221 domain-containing protein [unclassified Algoriphagus]UZD21632.1 DUF4221 domain-containing protein [Algoriphagus sp. TR-M5]WBL42844.1 DUF4221 domain-containing protein [Algoriphagus sp. TR-M9]
MKKLFSITLLVLFVSCGAKESEHEESLNLLENLTFTVDTLVVDVGEEIFNPGAYYVNDLSPDQSKAYFLYMENEIHEIDLEHMKLLNRYVFQQDGPDAIPQYPNTFQILPDDEVFLGGYAQTGLFKISGENVASFKVRPENLEGIPNDAPYSMTNSLHISPDKSTMVSLPNIFGEAIEGLAVINIADMSAKILDLPALELTSKYQLVFREGNGATAIGDFDRIKFLNNQFIIHSGATSDIYRYDWKTDSLQLLNFPHQLVPSSKTEEISANIDSREALFEQRKTLRKQITFSEFFWDKEKEMYFRFAVMNAQYNDEGREIGSDVYLFSYDKDWKLTGEKLVEELDHQPYAAFMKDGKFYTRWVVGENPAFVVYSFDF